ncbi:MAG: hypothetical protein JWO13_1026 [Acidobacteriales bacterium]|nr:hypothetical protein [Terriglobales bacterium]
MKTFASLAILLTLTISSFAQSSDRGFTVHAGGGYTPLVGPLSKRLDNGWNFQVGGGYMLTPHFGLVGDYQYNRLGVPQSVLTGLAVPDGSAWVHSLTFGPEIRFAPNGKVDPYFIGGLGWYRRTVEFTQPTLSPATGFDPFFGFFFPTISGEHCARVNHSRWIRRQRGLGAGVPDSRVADASVRGRQISFRVPFSERYTDWFRLPRECDGETKLLIR